MPCLSRLFLASVICLNLINSGGGIAAGLPAGSRLLKKIPANISSPAMVGVLPSQPLRLQAQVPSPSSTAPSSPTASPSPQASPTPPEPEEAGEGGLPGWLLGVVTFFVVGGGLSVFFLLKSFNAPSTEEEEEEVTPVIPPVVRKQSQKKRSDGGKRHRDRNGSAPSRSGAKATRVNPSSSGEGPLELGDGRLSRIDVLEEMVRELRSVDPAKRQKAIWELGQRGDTRAVQPLVDLMTDSDSRQRSLILAALSEIGTRTLKPLSRALAISLQDENPEVRKNAIRDLTRVYDLVAQISQLLQHATDDPDVEVRQTAQWALTQLNRIRPASSLNTLPPSQDVVSPPENLSGETRR